MATEHDVVAGVGEGLDEGLHPCRVVLLEHGERRREVGGPSRRP